MANKITQAEIDAINVQSNSGDTLTGTTAENKEVFDKLPEFIAEKYNDYVDYVDATYTSGDEITNLNSLTAKYTTATAVTNGDFQVDLLGIDTLASGDVVKISFPSATDNTANARLSVDGGSNYKNIYDELNSANILADEIENQSLELRYNGTQFVKVNTSGDSKLLASTTSTTFVGVTVDLSQFKTIEIMVSATPNRILNSMSINKTHFVNYCYSSSTAVICLYHNEPTAYAVQAYYVGGILYIKTASVNDKIHVYGIK